MSKEQCTNHAPSLPTLGYEHRSADPLLVFKMRQNIDMPGI